MSDLYKKTKKLLKKWGVTDEEADDFIKELQETKGEEDDEEAEDKKDVKEDLKEAEKDVEEKGETADQSEKDREDESVGEQLKEDGDKDSQTTEDRIDESKGEEKVEEKEHDHDEEAEQRAEGVQDDRIGAIEARLNDLIARFDELLKGNTAPEDDEDEEAYAAAEKRYGMKAGVFNAGNADESEKVMDGRKAAEIFRNMRNR